MQKSIAALVIHDIKNSLALLEADLEQLNHHADVPIEARKAYQRCVELKERLISFLTLYKHEHGGLQTNITELDLVEFMEDLISTSQSTALHLRHGHKTSVHLDENKIRISPDVRHQGIAAFDEYLLDMAIESALNNAVRYAASRVTLWFEQDVDKVTFYVLDDGPGLNHPGNLHHTPSGNTTGVGLILCETVAEVHGGGKVTLTDATDGGAIFTLQLHTPSH